MGKRLCLILAIIFGFNIICFAQKELQITYKVKNGITPEDNKNESFLRANGQFVTYEEINTQFIPNRFSGEVEEIKNTLNQVFKNYHTNTIWSQEMDEYVVKETMNLFSWKFTQESDTILSYSCKVAEANFLGRNYKAWFSTKIPFRAAPWKIHGLPGVVLKLESTDGFYMLEAINITTIEMPKEFNIPFNDKNSVTWDEYVLIYKKIIEERDRNNKAMEIQYGRKYDIPYPKIEVIVDKNRNTLDTFLKKEKLR